jgi:hypothetical protein
MAWTTPRTWVAGETVSAALMNVHVRDNLNLLASYFNLTTGYPAYLQEVRQTGDVTKNNSTVLGNLTGLVFNTAANETWIFIAPLHLISASGAGAKFGITYPAGATGRLAVVPVHASAASSAAVASTIVMTTIGTVDQGAVIYGLVINGATPGTVQLQFAQAAAQVSNSIVYTNSALIAVRIG